VIADDTGAIGPRGQSWEGRRTAIIGVDPAMCCWKRRILLRMPLRAARDGWVCLPTPRSVFERGVDPTLPAACAGSGPTALLLQIAGGEAGPPRQVTRAEGEAGQGGSRGVGELAPQAVSRACSGRWCRDANVEALLGAVTGGLGGPRRKDGGVRRPPHRFDIRIEADLIEESRATARIR